MWKNPEVDQSSSVVEELDYDELVQGSFVLLIAQGCDCETFLGMNIPVNGICVCPPCSVLIWECVVKVNVSTVCHPAISLIGECAVVVSEILP